MHHPRLVYVVLLLVYTALSDAAYWTTGVSETGDCTMIGKGCVSSYNYPSEYRNSQSCSITAPVGSKIDVVAFSTESVRYDFLTVNGKKYGGSSGPINVVLTSSRIDWR